jgi:sugar phosphate isomerase/epimerase
MVDLEFNRVDLALVESGIHLKPSDIADNFDAAMHRLREGPSLAPSALSLDFGEIDRNSSTYRRRFDAGCRLAKALSVAVVTIPAAQLGTPFDDEVARLHELSSAAMLEGLVVSLETAATTMTADPAAAVRLCEAVPGLGLTLDPSHYVYGPFAGGNFDDVFPFVQNVLLRDTGKKPGEFQVRVGQGQIEYGRIVANLERVGYDRALTVAIYDTLDSPFEVEVEVRKLKLLLESLL